MTRYLLDTNVISNIVKPRPSGSLLSWMSARRDQDLFVAVTDYEKDFAGLKIVNPLRGAV